MIIRIVLIVRMTAPPRQLLKSLACCEWQDAAPSSEETTPSPHLQSTSEKQALFHSSLSSLHYFYLFSNTNSIPTPLQLHLAQSLVLFCFRFGSYGRRTFNKCKHCITIAQSSQIRFTQYILCMLHTKCAERIIFISSNNNYRRRTLHVHQLQGFKDSTISAERVTRMIVNKICSAEFPTVEFCIWVDHWPPLLNW